MSELLERFFHTMLRDIAVEVHICRLLRAAVELLVEPIDETCSADRLSIAASQLDVLNGRCNMNFLNASKLTTVRARVPLLSQPYAFFQKLNAFFYCHWKTLSPVILNGQGFSSYAQARPP